MQQNVTAGSAPAPSVSVDPATNRINSTGYVYDAAGNMTNDTAHTYTYDAANWLTKVDGGATATYTYLGALRVKKVAGTSTTVYVYSGTKPIAEYATDANGTKLTEYIYAGAGTMLATIHPDGSITYQHPDHLSIRAESDSNGNVIRSTGNFPFGEQWYDTSPSANSKWQFTTYERDSESGLDYADFRFYSSRLGRFVQADLLGGSIGNPESLDRYSYVGNDPRNLIDPLGLVTNCTPYQLWNCWLLWGSDDGGAGGGFGGGAGTHAPVQDVPDVGSHGGAQVQKLFSKILKCTLDAGKVIDFIKAHFPQFGNFTGGFGPGGVPVATALVRFDSTPVSPGASIGISEISFGVLGGTPFLQSVHTSVAVQSVSNNSFTFSTDPGHVLHPATITFSAADTGSGEIQFSIQIAGDFANLVAEGLYYSGGSDLEDKIWNNFIDEVRKLCKK